MQHTTLSGRNSTCRTRDGRRLLGCKRALFHSHRMRLLPVASLFNFEQPLAGKMRPGTQVSGNRTNQALEVVSGTIRVEWCQLLYMSKVAPSQKEWRFNNEGLALRLDGCVRRNSGRG